MNPYIKKMEVIKKNKVPILMGLNIKQALTKLSKTQYKLRVVVNNGNKVIDTSPESFNKEINIDNYLFDKNRINVIVSNNVIIKVLGNY